MARSHETGFYDDVSTKFLRESIRAAAAIFDVDFVISAAESNAGDTYAGRGHRAAFHPGAANVLLMDGSVRSVANWRFRWRLGGALGNASGGRCSGRLLSKAEWTNAPKPQIPKE